MHFEHFYDPDLAQGSYLIGCQATGEAIVVDARRDFGVYLEAARLNGLRITAVTETHIHADYLSGSLELARVTGATLHVSAEGGPDWLYSFPAEPLLDGDVLRIGNISLNALHTPGHTPEHLSFLVRDGAMADEPGFLLSGDFVFVGDVGRPDLLDEVASGQDSRFEGARQLFRSLRDRFLTLPDYVQVWPGHGAGSACGRALGSVASTTVGYERRFAWWAQFVQRGDEEGFVRELLTDQPDAPAYFGRMKRQNRDGPALLGNRPAPQLLERFGSEFQVVDTRAREVFNEDGIRDAISVPDGKRFATYASYVIDPESSAYRPLVLLARDQEHASAMAAALARIGVDGVAGYIDGTGSLETGPAPLVAPDALSSLQQAVLLDVRTASEHAAGSIPDAQQLHAGRVMSNLNQLPADRPVVLHCQSGIRATVVASALRQRGIDARELAGNYPAWLEWSSRR